MSALASAGALLDDGVIGNVAALAEVAELRDHAGRRVLRIRMYEGWDFDVLCDRGLDISAAWWRSRPISWRSPISGDPGAGAAWAQRFLGGLVVTCGPDNIGGPRPGHGLHGTHSLTPAVDVRWERRRRSNDIEVRITGAIEDALLFGRRIRVEREIVVATSDPTIEIRDTIANAGLTDEPIAWLYHINIGAPTLMPGSTVAAPSGRWVVREETESVRGPSVLPPVLDRSEETVFEHLEPHSHDGWAKALVLSPEGSGVAISWTTASLPRLYQWVLPERGAWALGVEPANAPPWGPEREDPETVAPRLAPGAAIMTGIRVTAV